MNDLRMLWITSTKFCHDFAEKLSKIMLYGKPEHPQSQRNDWLLRRFRRLLSKRSAARQTLAREYEA